VPPIRLPSALSRPANRCEKGGASKPMIAIPSGADERRQRLSLVLDGRSQPKVVGARPGRGAATRA
jgi:hypothetical protein